MTSGPAPGRGFIGPVHGLGKALGLRIGT